MCWQYTVTLSLFSFSFPCLPNIFLLTFVTDGDICEGKTIACEVVFQFKSKLKVAVINRQLVAAFTIFITTVKRT